jgi:hypothetical protein
MFQYSKRFVSALIIASFLTMLTTTGALQRCMFDARANGRSSRGTRPQKRGSDRDITSSYARLI